MTESTTDSMTDSTGFERFIIEMRKLLNAITSQTDALRDATPPERRRHTLREIARLALAVGARPRGVWADGRPLCTRQSRQRQRWTPALGERLMASTLPARRYPLRRWARMTRWRI